MLSYRNQPYFHPDGSDLLGADYDPVDRDLDDRVGEGLRQLPLPEGLEDRVAQASIAARQQSMRMRLTPGRAAVAFKRLAVAACLTVAVLAAFWITSPSSPPVADPQLAQRPVTPVEVAPTMPDGDLSLSVLMALDGSGLITSHDLTWAQAHDELLTILEAENSSDAWGYLAVEIH